MAKESILLKALKLVGDAGIEAGDFCEGVLRAGYGASRGKLEQSIDRVKAERLTAQQTVRARQRYYDFIYRLRRDGLIEEIRKNQGKFIRLTKAGKAKLNQLRAGQQAYPSISYVAADHTSWVIVTFDVPERTRWKRDWLRVALATLGFRLLQRSVWLGKKKLPIAFMEDLGRLGLLDYVEILEISRTGSLRQVA